MRVSRTPSYVFCLFYIALPLFPLCTFFSANRGAIPQLVPFFLRVAECRAPSPIEPSSVTSFPANNPVVSVHSRSSNVYNSRGTLTRGPHLGGDTMHNANIHAAAPDLDKDGDEILLAQPVTDHQGSVVAEAFDIVKEEHKEMQVDEPVKGQAGPSRHKGKQRAPPIKQYEADPLYNFGPLDNVPEAVNNQRSLSLALFDTLKLNHTTARYEKQLRQEAKGVDVDPPPQPQHKPPKPSKELKIKMTELGWAVDQTIMIRPTIQFWYRNVKKPVFYKCCSMPYKKSYQRRIYWR